MKVLILFLTLTVAAGAWRVDETYDDSNIDGAQMNLIDNDEKVRFKFNVKRPLHMVLRSH